MFLPDVGRLQIDLVAADWAIPIEEQRLKPKTWSCGNRSSSCGGQRRRGLVSMVSIG